MPFALRVAITCCLLAAACSSSRATVESPEPIAGGAAPADEEAGAKGPKSAASDCGAGVCAYHAGADRYHVCAYAAAGGCVRYGPVCEPADLCMFDRRSATYRRCAQAGAGRCVEFGEACAPEGACMLDPDSERHRTCDEVADGRCAQFGAPCDPAQRAR
jgi:hypothetical protein